MRCCLGCLADNGTFQAASHRTSHKCSLAPSLLLTVLIKAEKPCPSTQQHNKREAAVGLPLSSDSRASIVDFLDDPAFAGLDDIRPVLALDIAILTQPR